MRKERKKTYLWPKRCRRLLGLLSSPVLPASPCPPGVSLSSRFPRRCSAVAPTARRCRRCRRSVVVLSSCRAGPCPRCHCCHSTHNPPHEQWLMRLDMGGVVPSSPLFLVVPPFHIVIPLSPSFSVVVVVVPVSSPGPLSTLRAEARSGVACAGSALSSFHCRHQF